MTGYVYVRLIRHTRPIMEAAQWIRSRLRTKSIKIDATSHNLQAPQAFAAAILDVAES